MSRRCEKRMAINHLGHLLYTPGFPIDDPKFERARKEVLSEKLPSDVHRAIATLLRETAARATTAVRQTVQAALEGKP